MILLLLSALFFLHRSTAYSQTRPPYTAQLPADILYKINNYEKLIKSLQDRPAITPEQAEYLRTLYDGRSSALTDNEVQYFKKLYDSRADVKTLIESEDTKLNAKLSQADSDTKAALDRTEKNLALEEKKLADAETSIWGNYFTVFGTIFAIMYPKRYRWLHYERSSSEERPRHR
jgi:hypothetical protein